MKVEVTRKDTFLDYMLTQGPEVTRIEIREDLKSRGFWSESEMNGALDKWLDKEVIRLVRELPKVDENGNVIERIHVTRTDKEGVKQDVYVQRCFLNYEDLAYAVQYRVDRSNYYGKEAKRLLEDGISSGRFTAKEVKKLRRTFQGLFEFEPATA